MPTTITPSIGRKVWLWSNHHSSQDSKQAFDATVIFVNSDTRITVSFNNHTGAQGSQSSVLLRDPKDTDAHGAVEEGLVATWMPYQVGQAKPAEAAPRESVLQHTEDPDHAPA